ncbi:hypothetical protein tb265_13620 [Gemmatimonadetes bacterium T265]|nr:hypothetical protein tb265_13620 [Gemmatimonadetes bacterium T265]
MPSAPRKADAAVRGTDRGAAAGGIRAVYCGVPRPADPWTRRLVAAALAVAAIGVVLTLALVAGRRLADRVVPPPAPPRISHDLVVEQVRSVAKLVSAEATVRDVVAYENTRFLSTKRALLVVTGRVSAGIDLDSTRAGGGVDVRVDDGARRISVALPPAEIFGVEVLSVRTYDEHAGLLNPFHPADRDSIQADVRAQLLRAGREMGLTQRASANAVALLRTLLARDGYTVDVWVRGPAPAPVGRAAG